MATRFPAVGRAGPLRIGPGGRYLAGHAPLAGNGTICMSWTCPYQEQPDPACSPPDRDTDQTRGCIILRHESSIWFASPQELRGLAWAALSLADGARSRDERNIKRR